MGTSRRDFLQGAVLLGTGALTTRLVEPPDRAVTGGSSLEAARRPFLPYTRGSFFKSRVDGAPEAVRRTKQFHRFMRTFPEQRDRDYPKLNGIGDNRWGTAFCFGRAGDPVWKVVGPGRPRVLLRRGLHAPLWITGQISGTSDSPVCVVDLANGYTVFLTKVRADRRRRTFHVFSAGVTYHSSNGLDRRNPRSNDPRNFTMRGRISDAMVIRRDLVEHGVRNGTSLGHVLHLIMTETNTKDGFCHPMTGHEKRHRHGFGAQGERIALRPDIDLRARGLTGAALVVARTLQEYGAYFGDNSGSASSLHCEQASATRHPWAGTNLRQTSFAGKISWDDFFVLPMGWQ